MTLVEKVFTRKLRVPTKHITHLADPCDSPPALTIKHLFIALLKIIQTNIINEEEQSHLKDTIRQIEKSAAGDEKILTAVVEWLRYVDTKKTPENDEMGVACILIDWAIGTALCRDELDADLEKLKALKSENAATLKTLRSGKTRPCAILIYRNRRKESGIA